MLWFEFVQGISSWDAQQVRLDRVRSILRKSNRDAAEGSVERLMLWLELQACPAPTPVVDNTPSIQKADVIRRCAFYAWNDKLRECGFVNYTCKAEGGSSVSWSPARKVRVQVGRDGRTLGGAEKALDRGANSRERRLARRAAKRARKG